MSRTPQDVDWRTSETDRLPLTQSPITLAVVIGMFEDFGYTLDGQWPEKDILNFVKEGEVDITIASPDFRSANGKPCYDRDMVVDMFYKTVVRNNVEGGVKLRASLNKASKN